MRVGDGEAMSGHIRLGVAELVAVTWLPAFVEQIQTNYPRLTLELTVALTAELQQMLSDGDVDLALIPEPDSTHTSRPALSATCVSPG